MTGSGFRIPMALTTALVTTLLFVGCGTAVPEDETLAEAETSQATGSAQAEEGDSQQDAEPSENVTENEINDDQTEEALFISGSKHVTTYVPSADEVERINSLDWSVAGQHMTPDASRAAGTVAHPTAVDPSTSQVFYLWEKGNMPGGDGYDAFLRRAFDAARA